VSVRNYVTALVLNMPSGVAIIFDQVMLPMAMAMQRRLGADRVSVEYNKNDVQCRCGWNTASWLFNEADAFKHGCRSQFTGVRIMFVLVSPGQVATFASTWSAATGPERVQRTSSPKCGRRWRAPEQPCALAAPTCPTTSRITLTLELTMYVCITVSQL
jgi:hypothetical protein